MLSARRGHQDCKHIYGVRPRRCERSGGTSIKGFLEKTLFLEKIPLDSIDETRLERIQAYLTDNVNRLIADDRFAGAGLLPDLVRPCACGVEI